MHKRFINFKFYFIIISLAIFLSPSAFVNATLRTVVWTSKEAWNNNPLKSAGSGVKSVSYVDIDGDGLLDLFANANGVCTISAYKNTGSIGSPSWTATTSRNISNCSTTVQGQASFGDIDGDGLIDAMYGGYDSYGVWFYKNTGSTTEPIFTRDNAYDISIGAPNKYTRSSILDLNNDGLLDVVVIDNLKTPFFFQNTGSSTVPVFTRQTDWEPVLSDAGGAAPTASFADLDGDGDFDFVVGYHYNGGVFAYENTGSVSVPAFARKASWDLPLVQGSTTVDRVAGLTFGDIDNDGDSDIMIAGRLGNNSYAFENTGAVLSSPSLSVGLESNISITSVTINASITNDNNASSTQRGFAWGLTTAYGATTTETGTYGVGSFSTTLSDLTCNTTYHYSAYAVNLAGTSTTADDTFTTSACPVAPASVSSSGSSLSSRINNLVAMGNIEEANQLRALYLGVAPIQPVATSTNQNPTPTPTVNGNVVFIRNLTVGNEGNDVRELQRFLNSRGYIVSFLGNGSKGNETTYFGILTKKALIKFQKANGIPNTGYFGPITMGFINKTNVR